MRRGLAVAALVFWSAVALAPATAAQTPPPRPRPAASRPEAPARDGRSAPVTVDADQLENLQKEGLVVFTGNVVATQDRSTQYADRMEVYLDDKRDRIVRTVSTGNVRIITRGADHHLPRRGPQRGGGRAAGAGEGGLLPAGPGRRGRPPQAGAGPVLMSRRIVRVNEGPGGAGGRSRAPRVR
jgi:hypothetical protein